jgi:methylated-DNA-protein-cysteine methyltransferase-like protein
MRHESDPPADFPTSDLADRVYAVVRRIPYGRVTTYGTIAHAVGKPRGARQVGWLMYSVPAELELPCHRVVNSAGYLSGGWHFGHPDIMKERLVAEEVPFKSEYTVDLRKCLWYPWEDEELAAADRVDDLDLVAGVE